MNKIQKIDPKYKYFLIELSETILERAFEALKARDRIKKKGENSSFEDGRILAFNEVLSILQQEARGFGINLKELKLDKIDPDRDFILGC